MPTLARKLHGKPSFINANILEILRIPHFLLHFWWILLCCYHLHGCIFWVLQGATAILFLHKLAFFKMASVVEEM